MGIGDQFVFRPYTEEQLADLAAARGTGEGDPRSVGKVQLVVRVLDDRGEERHLSLVPNGSAIEAFVYVLEGCLNTYVAKDRAYGAAWRAQGWMGNLARIMSKTARLKEMLWRGDRIMEAGGESVRDTLQDLINLAVFMTLNLGQENEWGYEPSVNNG